jgi:signal transduction histidine kinase
VRPRLHPLDALLGVVTATVVGLDLGLHDHARPLVLVLGVLAGASLLLVRLAPLPVYLAGGAPVIALTLLQHHSGTTVAVPVIALYVIGRRSGRAPVLLAALTAPVVTVIVDAVAGDKPLIRWDALAHAALALAPLVAGLLVRGQRERKAAFLERLELAERTREEVARRRVEEERLRIARDLHDVVAHTLTAINVQAGVAGHLIRREPERAGETLASIARTSKDALDELRGIVGVLRSGEEAPLEPVPGIDALAELVAEWRRRGLPVDLVVRGERPAHVPEAVQVAAYRIVQESLTNVSRHVGEVGTVVELDLEPERLRLLIRNDPPVEPQPAGDGPGVGIMGMRERAVALGGSLSAAGEPGGGFVVEAELPSRREP